jgi:hypothetical protein
MSNSPKKTSVARVEQKAGVTLPNYPKITVTANSVTVVSVSASHTAHADSTALQGTGGLFTFASAGTYPVQPGQYDHFVSGRITNNGWIEAVIEYT